MLTPALVVNAAAIYQLLRSKGITIRKNGDLLIGTFCIEHRLPLVYNYEEHFCMEKHLMLSTI